MIKAEELQQIINSLVPNSETVLLIGDVENLNLPTRRVYKNRLEGKYDVIYVNTLWKWNIVWDLFWIETLERLLNPNGLMVFSIYYMQTHFIPGWKKGRFQIIKKVDLPDTEIIMKTKVNWMKLLSTYWKCVFDGGIHTGWMIGPGNPWGLPKSLFTIKDNPDFRNKPFVKTVYSQYSEHSVWYDWRQDAIREMGSVVEPEHVWYSSVSSLVSAYYQRALGGSKLVLRSSRRPCAIPGIISIPKGTVFRNVSDPFI